MRMISKESWVTRAMAAGPLSASVGETPSPDSASMSTSRVDGVVVDSQHLQAGGELGRQFRLAGVGPVGVKLREIAPPTRQRAMFSMSRLRTREIHFRRVSPH